MNVHKENLKIMNRLFKFDFQSIEVLFSNLMFQKMFIENRKHIL